MASSPQPETTLLLVEDDEHVRVTFGAILESAGFDVTEAATLAQARQAIARQAFSVAVLDLDLPDGKGRELIADLRRTYPGVAIAILSGEAPQPIPGVDVYLVKATAPDALLALLRRARHHAAQDGSEEAAHG